MVADALGRIEIKAVFRHAADIDWCDFATAQQHDPAIQNLVTHLRGENIDYYEWQGVKFLCSISHNGRPRYLVPCGFRKLIFDHIHSLHHPGSGTTRRQIAAIYTWPNLRQDCDAWSKTCHPCRHSKIHRYNKTALQHFPLTSERALEVHVDLIGSLIASDCCKYVIVFIDRFTHWFTATALPQADAKHVISAFIND